MMHSGRYMAITVSLALAFFYSSIGAAADTEIS
jgi:hypothetical protein